MFWTFAVVIVSVLAWLVYRSPSRRAIAANLAAHRACKTRDWAGADKLCHDALATAAKLKEPRKSFVEASMELLHASVLYRQGRMREAEERFRFGFIKARAARCHHKVTPVYLFWGNLCTDEGRYNEAEQHYRAALEGDEKIGNLAGMIFDLQRLADSLIRQNRRTEAEEIINQAIQLETRVVHQQMLREGKDPAKHHVISWSLPDLRFCREQYDDARRLYREKVEHWEKSVARPDNIDLGHLQMRLAFAEERTGHRAEAVEMYKRAAGTFQREWCEDHPKVLAALAAKAALAQEMAEVPGK